MCFGAAGRDWALLSLSLVHVFLALGLKAPVCTAGGAAFDRDERALGGSLASHSSLQCCSAAVLESAVHVRVDTLMFLEKVRKTRGFV